MRGDPGDPGKKGRNGRKGDIGPKGKKGKKGKTGRPGPSASKGDVGPAGTKGARGEPGTRKFYISLDLLLAVDLVRCVSVTAAGGSLGASGVTYVHWGKKTCTAYGVQTLYSGIAAGTHHSHAGGGANTLCLPLDPVWGYYKDGYQGASYIYGAEYQLWQGIQPFINKRLKDYDVPCAVCYDANKNTQFMLPAKNTCPTAWSRAYYGYLMAERHSHSGRIMYVCVDYNAEGFPGSYRNDDEHLFHPVEGVCGSLPCPPYVNGRELTCAVCLK
ncbi:short-chain collagen C4-like [Corticium candelabrum]|uniref:short-chain collagen C4-like n=1 Tax=Corticium candelabrum TaxID=121492 RepID=UPI002E273B71|nr:short-chain collagen C4-like [Corticium candelabrum]